MTGRDLWAALYPQVCEVFRLMMTGEAVEVKHPRYAGTVGTVEALIIRPGKDNVYEITVAAEVKEAGRNSVHVALPEYIRKVGRNGDQAGYDPLDVERVQGSGEAGGDHSGLLRDAGMGSSAGTDGGGEAAGVGDGAELQSVSA